MRDYQYLMKRSGYRSYMDVPGRRILGDDTPKQAAGVGERTQKSYIHPSDRPAFPAMEPQTQQQIEAEQLAEEAENGEIYELSPGVYGNRLTGETNVEESAEEVLESVTPNNSGSSAQLQQQIRGSSPYSPITSNQNAQWQNSSQQQANMRASNSSAANENGLTGNQSSPNQNTQPQNGNQSAQNQSLQWQNGNSQTPVRGSQQTSITTLSPQSVSGSMAEAGAPNWMVYETGILPEVVSNSAYMPGYLRTQMGKLIHVDFYTGDTMSEQTGILMQVGADYIILAAPDKGLPTICDLSSILFVTIMDNSPEPPILSAIQ